ncbi:MAG: hypothetical protein GF390_02645 [Candidatus Pacebacteria bacterium]|nr:hypothetical protein [Candidatus Paceibacterota bacterium]
MSKLKTTLLITSLATALFFSQTNNILSVAIDKDSDIEISPTIDPADPTTKNLKERIEKVVEEKKDQIKGTIDDLSQKSYGFIAQVQRLTEETITVENQDGTQILAIDDQVTLVKDGQEIELTKVAVDDWLIIMGYQEDAEFNPKRIVVSSESLRPSPHLVMFGTIKSLSRSKLDLEPRQKQNETEVLSLTLSQNIEFQDLQGETSQTSLFTEGLQVLVVGYQNEDGEQIITTIRSLAPLTETE